MRLDQWLWAVRAYRSRTLAAQAVKSGAVRIAGERLKPAHVVHPGERIELRLVGITRTLLVLGSPPSRVGAKLVAEFAEDLTPPEEVAKLAEARRFASGLRPRGAGRPTKRDRRALDALDEP